MTTLPGTYRLNSKTAVTTQYKFVSQKVTNVTSYVSLRHMSTIKDSNQRHVNRCLNIAYGTLMSIYIVFTRRPMYTCLFYLNRYKEYTRHTIETTEENESEPRNTINVYRIVWNWMKKNNNWWTRCINWTICTTISI